MSNVASPAVSAGCQQTRNVTSGAVLDFSYMTGGNPTLTADPANDACCVDKGMIDSGMTIKDDYQPVTRPLGQGYDIGAFEVR